MAETYCTNKICIKLQTCSWNQVFTVATAYQCSPWI